MSSENSPRARLPHPWLPVFAPATGRPAAAVYLRTHLYGAAVGRRLLDRCIRALDGPERVRLVPLGPEFDDEIATARRLLAGITPIGTPGRTLLGLGAGAGLRLVPAGPRLVDPLSRLALLEALRTLVVAKRSMWVLLAEVGHLGEENEAELRELAHRASAQEALLESLRLEHGRRALG